MAGIGTAIWLMGALVPHHSAPPASPHRGRAFWNLGVLLGVGGILAGDSTGYEWLEFPPYAAIVLFTAYSLVVSWAILMFRFRRGDHIYITQWYLLAGLSLVPLVYGATQIMLLWSVAGSNAGSGHLVVRQQSSFPLVLSDLGWARRIT